MEVRRERVLTLRAVGLRGRGDRLDQLAGLRLVLLERERDVGLGDDSDEPAALDDGESPNLVAGHAGDFRNLTGFTYTVLEPASRDVIGCVYIYPLPDSDHDACALSWVRESHAHLDTSLWRAVSEWLASDWPFGSVRYAPRA